MTTRARWTALDELTLRAGVQDGLPLAIIAGQLGRTPTAVREKRKRLGLRSVRPAHPVGGRRRADHGRGLSQDGDELGWPRLAAAHRWTAGASLALRRHRAVGSGRAAGGGRRHPAGAITDAELRAYAVEQRAQHPRWLRLTRGRAALSRHVRHGGRLGGAGALCRRAPARYGGLWIREDALHWLCPAVRAALGTDRVLPATRAHRAEHAANGGPDLSDLLAQRARAARRPPAAPRAAGQAAHRQRRPRPSIASGGPREPRDHVSGVRPPRPGAPPLGRTILGAHRRADLARRRHRSRQGGRAGLPVGR